MSIYASLDVDLTRPVDIANAVFEVDDFLRVQMWGPGCSHEAYYTPQQARLLALRILDALDGEWPKDTA